jgi:hypothetical protein
MDAHQQLAFDSEFSVAVMGNAGEFILIQLGEPLDDNVTRKAIERGFRYCGCLGIKDGVPGAKCESDPDAIYTCLLASLAFARMVCERLKPPSKGDGVEWLTRLFALSDTRTDA